MRGATLGQMWKDALTSDIAPLGPLLISVPHLPGPWTTLVHATEEAGRQVLGDPDRRSSGGLSKNYTSLHAQQGPDRQHA